MRGQDAALAAPVMAHNGLALIAINAVGNGGGPLGTGGEAGAGLAPACWPAQKPVRPVAVYPASGAAACAGSR